MGYPEQAGGSLLSTFEGDGRLLSMKQSGYAIQENGQMRRED
jgi:hypothetical protein